MHQEQNRNTFSPSEILPIENRISDVTYLLKDATFKFEPGGKLLFTPNGESDALDVRLTARELIGRTAQFFIELVIADKNDPATVYNLEDLNLEVFQVKPGETPLIEADLREKWCLVVGPLIKNVLYMFSLPDGGNIRADHDPFNPPTEPPDEGRVGPRMLRDIATVYAEKEGTTEEDVALCGAA